MKYLSGEEPKPAPENADKNLEEMSPEEWEGILQKLDEQERQEVANRKQKKNSIENKEEDPFSFSGIQDVLKNFGVAGEAAEKKSELKKVPRQKKIFPSKEEGLEVLREKVLKMPAEKLMLLSQQLHGMLYNEARWPEMEPQRLRALRSAVIWLDNIIGEQQSIQLSSNLEVSKSADGRETTRESETEFSEKNLIKNMLDNSKVVAELFNQEVIAKWRSTDAKELTEKNIDLVLYNKEVKGEEKKPLLMAGVKTIDLQQDEEESRDLLIDETQTDIRTTLSLNTVPKVTLRIPEEQLKKLIAGKELEQVEEIIEFMKEDLRIQLATNLLATIEKNLKEDENKREILRDYRENKKLEFAKGLQNLESFKDAYHEVKQYVTNNKIESNLINNIFSSLDSLNLKKEKDPQIKTIGGRYFQAYNNVLA